MPLVIRCEHCQAQLRLPEEYIGQAVKCPSCQREFVARESLQSPPARPAPPPQPPNEDEAPRREDDRPRRDRDDYEARPSRRRRYYDDDSRRLEPHRGGTVQTLGVLSLCLFCFPLISVILGIVALNMASTDLAKMRGGYMDPRGEGPTNSGKTCATIGLILAAIAFVGGFCLMCAGGAGHNR